jgi:limonene-1,2-epoxide hydrolase
MMGAHGPVASAFCSYLDAFGSDPEDALARIDVLYDDDLVFTDPIQTLRGRRDFKEMNEKFVRAMRSIRFEVEDVVEQGPRIVVSSRLTVRPRLGVDMTFDSISRLEVGGERITFQRDYFDVLGGALSGAPALLRAYRGLVRRLS